MKSKINLKQMFPNAKIGQDVIGACNVYDAYGEVIGWTDYKVFHLRSEYERAQEAYERLLEFDVEIEVSDVSKNLYGEP